MTTDIQLKRVIDLTADEFAEVLAEALARAGYQKREAGKSEPARKKNLVYGIGGIAQLFNCSKTTANRIKASGIIDKAISQTGRIISVDADLALELMKKYKEDTN